MERFGPLCSKNNTKFSMGITCSDKLQRLDGEKVSYEIANIFMLWKINTRKVCGKR